MTSAHLLHVFPLAKSRNGFFALRYAMSDVALLLQFLLCPYSTPAIASVTLARMNKTFVNALLVFAAGASYGFIVPAVKAAVEIGVYPADFLPLQYLVALIVCVGFALVRRVKFANARESVKMALLGALTGCTSICYYTSVSMLPGAVALTLLFQYVWVSVLIECLVERKLPSRSTVIAVCIVLVGTLFAAGVFEGSITTLNPFGVAAGAGSAVFYALYLYLSGRIGVDQPASLRAAMLPAGGLIATSIANPACYTTAFFDPLTWPFAIGMSIIGVILPTTLINYASPKLSTGMVSVMASSELPVGILAAWVLVGDVPSVLTLFGAILVLAGIVFKQLGNLKEEGTRTV